MTGQMTPPRTTFAPAPTSQVREGGRGGPLPGSHAPAAAGLRDLTAVPFAPLPPHPAGLERALEDLARFDRPINLHTLAYCEAAGASILAAATASGQLVDDGVEAGFLRPLLRDTVYQAFQRILCSEAGAAGGGLEELRRKETFAACLRWARVMVGSGGDFIQGAGSDEGNTEGALESWE